MSDENFQNKTAVSEPKYLHHTGVDVFSCWLRKMMLKKKGLCTVCIYLYINI